MSLDFILFHCSDYSPQTLYDRIPLVMTAATPKQTNKMKTKSATSAYKQIQDIKFKEPLEL